MEGNVFTSMCQEFCPRGESAQRNAGIHTTHTLGIYPCRQTPLAEPPPRPMGRHPLPRADTPSPRADIPTPGRHPGPPGRHPLGGHPRNRADHPQHYGIRSTSGRYAFYWKAFLFKLILVTCGVSESYLKHHSFVIENCTV